MVHLRMLQAEMANLKTPTPISHWMQGRPGQGAVLCEGVLFSGGNQSLTGLTDKPI